MIGSENSTLDQLASQQRKNVTGLNFSRIKVIIVNVGIKVLSIV